MTPFRTFIRDTWVKGDLLARIETIYGARYGGTWLAPSSETFLVGVQNPEAPDYAALAALYPLSPSYFAVVPVTYSLEQLEDFKTRVDRAFLEMAKPTPFAFGSCFQIRREINKVSVITDVDHPALDAVREVVPPDALQFEVQPGLRAELVNASRTTYPPYEGGLRLRINGDDQSWCTSSYLFSTAEATYGSTAGHCQEEQGVTALDVGGTAVGDMNMSFNSYWPRNPNDSDAGLFYLSNLPDEHKIYVSPNRTRPRYREDGRQGYHHNVNAWPPGG